MPINGIKFKGTLKYGLHSGAVTSDSSAYLNVEYDAILKGFYIVDALNVETGFSLTMILQDGTVGRPNGSTTLIYNGPNAPFGGFVYSAGEFQADAYIDAYFDVTIYGMDNCLLKLVCSAVRVDMNGTETNLGGFDQTSTGLGPAYLPVVGGFYYVESQVTAGDASFPFPTYDVEIAGDFPLTGGFSFKRDGSDVWESLPISLPDASARGNPQNTCTWTSPNLQTTRVFGTGSGPFGLSAVLPTTATETWGEISTATGYYHYYLTGTGTGMGPNGLESGTFIEEFNNIHGGCYFYPDTAKAWGIFESDTVRNLAFAFRKPGVSTTWQRSFHTSYNSQGPSGTYESHYGSIGTVPSGLISPAIGVLGPLGPAFISAGEFALTGTENICTARAGELASIDNSGSRIDDQFDIVYSWPWSINNHYFGQQDFDYSTSPDTIINDQRQETVSFGDDGGYIVDSGSVENTPLGHNSNLVRYYHSPLVSPGWSTMFHAEDWDLRGSPVYRESYWKEGGIQYYSNSSIEAEHKDFTRSDDVITAVGSVNAFQPWIDNYYGFDRDNDDVNDTGTGMDWLGNPGTWHTEQVNSPSSHTYTAESSSLFTIPEGTGTINFASTGITIDPTGSSVDLTLRLGSWDIVPFMLPHIMEKVTANWSIPASASCQLVGVGVDNSEFIIASSPGSYRLGQGKSNSTAGTWVISNEINSGVVTSGTDVITGGISLSAVSDPELYTCFSLLQGHSPYSLRFKFTGVSSGLINVSWPILTRSGIWNLVWQNRQICAMVDTYTDGSSLSGPILLYGATLFYDPLLGWHNPPTPQALGFKPSVVDGLAFINLWLLGKPESYNVTTRLTELYDSFEGQSLAQSDKNSMAIPLPQTAGNPLAFAFVNTCATFPTLPFIPPAAPDTSTWLLNGAPENKIWLNGINPRQIISNDYPVSMTTASGLSVGTSGTILLGDNWYVTKFQNALTNNEGNDYQLNWNGYHIANVCPWFGYNSSIAIPSITPPTSSYFWTDNLYCRGLSTVFQSSGGINYKYWPLPGYKEFDYIIGTSDWKYPSLSRYNKDRILLTYIDSGKIYEKLTADYETWYDLENYGMNILYPKNILIGTTRVRIWFQYVSGDSGTGYLYIQHKEEAGNWTSPVLATLGGYNFETEDTPFGLSLYNKNRLVVTTVLAGESDSTNAVTADYETFKKI